ncbi:MAG: carboxypeptidase-like regulatory domain-containing protein [Rikenellaceae bacterium]
MIDLTERYEVELSFDSELLSRHSITIDREFESVDNLLDYLFDGLPFEWELIGGAYVIFPKEIERPKPIIGRVVDSQSGEPLPFAYVMVDGEAVASDENGNYVVEQTDIETNRIKASYLGYYKLDTLQNIKANSRIALTSAPLTMDAVVISSSRVERATQVGEQAGLLTVNQQIAGYLPGNGDDAIFNLLRLQPGVLASGEQSNELILWGSPEGTSRTYYDNIPLWGLSNFNDNISVINPFMVSRIDLYRGGYGADSPDAAGGVAQIRGKVGSNSPTASLLLNNETLNGSVQIPIGKRGRVIAAYRQNYLNLFEPEDFKQTNKLTNSDTEITTESNYKFRDCNLKYTFNGNNGDLFYISSLYGSDEVGYNSAYETEVTLPNSKTAMRNVDQGATDGKRQFGVSSYYGKRWSNGFSSSLTATYSQLRNNYDFRRTFSDDTNETLHNFNIAANNSVSEMTFKLENSIRVATSHTLSFGLEYNNNDISVGEDGGSEGGVSFGEGTNRVTIYAEDRYQIIETLSLCTGVRSTHNVTDNKQYFDPRIAANYQPLKSLRFNLAWGLYHQYVAESSVEDDSGNYVYCWNLAGVGDIPVLKSQHLVLGAAYTPKNYIFTIDGYHKSFDGLTRYVAGDRYGTSYRGDSQVVGLDLYAKRDFRGGSSVWLSYSLSKSGEHFDHFLSDDYLRSPLDQRHEFKAAAICRLGRFHLCATYIYGSGFPLYTSYKDKIYTESNYNRLDVSAIYSFKSSWCSGDIGISALNVTNAQNEKYSSFNRIPIDQQNSISIESGSTPFTPLLYIKLHL